MNIDPPSNKCRITADKLATAISCFAVLAAILAASVMPGMAGDVDDDKEPADTLRPLTFQSFASVFKQALAKVSVRDVLRPLNCLEGDANKPKVCPYMLGEYTGINLSSEKGGPELVAISLLCSTAKLEDAGKCLLADQAAMNITATVPSENDGKILKHLLDGMPLGHETTVTTDNRKYTMQTGLGIWLYIAAANSWEAQ
jgi:hypothetical protein